MSRKNWIIVGAVASFVLVLCCACVAGFMVWRGTSNAPDATVEQYLTAVRDGDSARAEELTCGRAGVATQLLTTVTEVVDWDVAGSQTYDSSAEVTARVTFRVFGITESRRFAFTLVRGDDHWQVCGMRSAR